MANQDTPLTLAFSISVGGDFVGKQEFEQDMVTIGKGSTAVLQIQDDQLADLHAAVQLGDDGEITVLDLGSETGTLLNGSPVNNDKIADGDEIRLGNTVVTVNVIQPAEEPEDDTDNVASAVAQPSSSHAEAEAEIHEAEDVMDFVLRSGTSESDIGINRNAPKVFEVAEIWSGTVMNVKHFDKDTKAVYVGDIVKKPFRIFSGIFTTILVVGAVFFMAQGEKLQGQWDHSMLAQRVELGDDFQPLTDSQGMNFIQISDEKRAQVDPAGIGYPGVPNNISSIAAWQDAIDKKKAAEREALKAKRAEERAAVEAEVDEAMDKDRRLSSKISKRLKEAKKDDPETTLTADEVRNDIRNELINELEAEQDKAKKEAEAAALPKNLYKEYKDAWLEDTKKAFEKAIQRNRDQSIVSRRTAVRAL